MKTHKVVVSLDTREVPKLEDLAWEHACTCVTHQPRHIDDWPGEIHDLPTSGEVITELSFSTLEEAEAFHALLQKQKRWDSSVTTEDVLPWIEYHKPFMQPIQIGYLTILPQEPNEPMEANTLYLPAGLAFGRGQHATTRSCLLLLQEVGCHHHKVIDFGCGSGILGLAALLFGAHNVQAHDHDHQALQATQAHARAHNMQKALLIIENQKNLQPASLLCANILFDPLIELKDRFCTLLKSRGYGIFSGILKEQAPSFKDHYLKDFDLITELEDDGWSSFLLQKKS